MTTNTFRISSGKLQQYINSKWATCTDVAVAGVGTIFITSSTTIAKLKSKYGGYNIVYNF